MNTRAHVRFTLFCLLAVICSVVQPIASASPRPTSIATQASVPRSASVSPPDTARDAKLEAIRLVEAMQYPDPDVTPPGKDFRKEYILQELRASIDGTFRSDNFLIDGRAFDHDVNAGKRLRDLLTDPNVDTAVKDLATQALQLIVTADRLVTVKAIEATTVFGSPLPKGSANDIRRANQELSKGDSKVAKGMPVDAVRDYRKAWEYTNQALNSLWTAFDPDGDKLLPPFEATLGTNPKLVDTDGDGLTDGDEGTKTSTDPTKADTDSNGTRDGDEDLDGDGLRTQDELQAGTNPLQVDTDGEGLDDRVEVREFGSDPGKQDTDADGLTDDSERHLGTNPRNPDTNGNTVPDGLETYTSTTTKGEDVVVALTGTGDVARTVTIQDVSADTRFSEHARSGVVGS